MSHKFTFTPWTGLTEEFFKRSKTINRNLRKIFHKWGPLGVEALSNATPVDTGETATSWFYNVNIVDSKIELVFSNDVIVGNTTLAYLLEVGHMSRSGTFVPGHNYINPAIEPIFEGLQKDVNEELKKYESNRR